MKSLEYAYEVYRKNKLNRKSWLHLVEELLAAGRREEAVLYASLLERHGGGIKAPDGIKEADFLATEAGWDFFRLGLMNISNTPLTFYNAHILTLSA